MRPVPRFVRNRHGILLMLMVTRAMARGMSLLTLAIFLSQSPVFAQYVPVKGVDLFGTRQISVREIQQRFGDDIDKLVQSLEANEGWEFVDLYSKVTLGIQEMGKFAYAEISPVIYFDKEKFCYVTIDIVEEKDRKRRMTFLPPPHKQFADPDGLLATWYEYEETAIALINKGELSVDKAHCPALNCVWGFDHPSLKRFQEAFQSKVPANIEKLRAILGEDQVERHRARAVFLLAHTSDSQKLVRMLLPSLKDSSVIVRKNVMQVLLQLATRPDVVISVDPLLEVLEFPSTNDRSKALLILDSLSTREENKTTLIHKGSVRLIQILRLLQPNHHDYAYTILKKISGKDFGERNYKGWEQWLVRQRRIRR